MCAAPFAPPPESTSPTLGRALVGAGVSCAYATVVIVISTIAYNIQNIFLIVIPGVKGLSVD